MEYDIAAVRQGMEQLKATQEQMARGNARLAEQNQRPKAAPPRQPISPTEERAVILGALTDNKGPMTPTELATATGQSNRNIRRSLYQMLKSGEIVRYERGRYGLQPKNNDNADQNGPAPALTE
jgi:predicted HTH transcriptional regulator